MDGAEDADGILLRFHRKKSEIGMGGAPLAARRHVIHFFVTKIRCCEESECFFLFVHFGDRLTMKRDVLLLLNRKKKQMKRFIFFCHFFSLFFFSAQIALSQIVVFVYRACERKRKIRAVERRAAARGGAKKRADTK